MVDSKSKERVYTVTDYWDGPRRGIADFNREPHVYECIFSEEDDDWTDTFRLQRVSSEILALAMEDWEIFLRWETAFQEGTVAQSTHPALPSDKARSDKLATILEVQLAVQPGCTLVSRARFQAGSQGWNNYVVNWDPL